MVNDKCLRISINTGQLQSDISWLIGIVVLGSSEPKSLSLIALDDGQLFFPAVTM